MKPLEIDTFQHSSYYSSLAKRQKIIWDYNDKKGILHSGVVNSLDEALEKAKKFGYHPNEFVPERKPQHDFIGRTYPNKVPKKTRIKKIKYAGLTGLIAAAIGFSGFINFFPETTERVIGYFTSMDLGGYCQEYKKSRETHQNLIKRKNFFEKEQGALEKQLPPKVYACFKEACKIKYKDEKNGKDYWKTPEETKEKRTGDCEDIAFYLYDLLKKEGIESRVATGVLNYRHYPPPLHTWDEYKQDEGLIIYYPSLTPYTSLHVWNEYTHNKEKFILDATRGLILKRKFIEEENPRTRYIRSDEIGVLPPEIKEKENQMQEFIKEYYNSINNK